MRAEFDISRAELRDDDRGAADADLKPLDDAAHSMAVAENKAVFHGWPEASITGITEASPHGGFTLGAHADSYPRPVAGAVEALLESGHQGPVRARARIGLLQARRRDRRARRLPAP